MPKHSLWFQTPSPLYQSREMAMTNEEHLKFYMWLLEQEVEALRSVLSEWAEDKNQFTQWIKASAIDELKNNLRRP